MPPSDARPGWTPSMPTTTTGLRSQAAGPRGPARPDRGGSWPPQTQPDNAKVEPRVVRRDRGDPGPPDAHPGPGARLSVPRPPNGVRNPEPHRTADFHAGMHSAQFNP